ncbi:FAD binding domain-containing protein [Ancylobacter terrae]|uniref:FAD binding domain-containing protein n=1 Tax=Ancylobacter sp. sgz301288 TaxID=3342077 RepID=UPI00385D9827
MKPAPFDYLRPESVREAVAALAEEGARALGGGQSLGPMLNLRLARPARLVDVGRLPELRRVTETPEGVLFGAAVTHAEIEDGAVPDPTRGVMPAIARGIAYRAVRNRGTIGGSLAHADPAADWPLTLVALDAIVHLTALTGHRQMPVSDFITGAFETALKPGEIISGVFVPRLSDAARWGYHKACRKVGEFAEAMCALLVDSPRGVSRMAVGAIEAKPIIMTDQSVVADPARLDPVLRAAGLDADAATFHLHRAVIRRAVAMVKGEGVTS